MSKKYFIGLLLCLSVFSCEGVSRLKKRKATPKPKPQNFTLMQVLNLTEKNIGEKLYYEGAYYSIRRVIRGDNYSEIENNGAVERVQTGQKSTILAVNSGFFTDDKMYITVKSTSKDGKNSYKLSKYIVKAPGSLLS